MLFEINQFLGIDTRPGHIGENVPAFIVGDNIDVITGGAIKSRQALRLKATLHAQSKGLYARGGVLHAVVPGGQSLQAMAPPGFIYDGIGDGTAYPLNTISRVVAADTYDVDPVYGPNGFLAIERVDEKIEYHWAKQPASDDSMPVSTKVDPGFDPGPSIVKLNNKIVGIDPSLGNVPFSSTVNGPAVWDTVGDAGFLPVSSHVSGNRETKGVSHHRGMLAVLFDDAIQLWNFDEDPALHSIAQVFNGPGAMLYGSVINVLGDMFYLSRGGFRNLQTVAVTGQSDENDQIGSPIKSLTDLITSSDTAVALWSQARSQYIVFIGTRAYVLTYLPKEKLIAWTTWTLPVAVDYAVELEGVLNIRSGNDVYEFTSSYDTDEGDTPIYFTVETQDWSLGKAGRVSELLWLSYRQSALASWRIIIDGVDMALRRYPASPTALKRVPIAGQGRQFAIRITGTGSWRLDGLTLEHELLGV